MSCLILHKNVALNLAGPVEGIGKFPSAFKAAAPVRAELVTPLVVARLFVVAIADCMMAGLVNRLLVRTLVDPRSYTVAAYMA